VSLRYEVVGQGIQMFRCDLEPGQSVYAASGRLLYKSPAVSVETRLATTDDQDPEQASEESRDPAKNQAPPPAFTESDSSDGQASPPKSEPLSRLHLSKAAPVIAAATTLGKQALSGVGFALQWFTAPQPVSTASGQSVGQQGQQQPAVQGAMAERTGRPEQPAERPSHSSRVAFAGAEPGAIVTLELDEHSGWYLGHGSLLCAEATAEFQAVLSSLRAGLESGEGLALGHVRGPGTLALWAQGTTLEIDPADHGGQVDVHSGALVAFEDSLHYTVQRIGGMDASTFVGGIFGGEGFYLVTISGQGRVILQSATGRSLTSSFAHKGIEKLAKTI